MGAGSSICSPSSHSSRPRPVGRRGTACRYAPRSSPAPCGIPIRMRLEGLAALITGGGSGIGAATARRFVAEAAVVVTGGRPEPLEQLAGDIGAVAVPGDATSAEDVRRAVSIAVERNGGLDILVANAGGAGTAAAGETGDEAWRAALESNLTSAFLAAARRFRRCSPAAAARSSSSRPRPRSWRHRAGGIHGREDGAARAHSLARGRLRPSRHPCQRRVSGWVRTGMADEQMDILAAARGLTREEAYEWPARHSRSAVPPSRRRSPPSASSSPPASRRSSRAPCFPSTVARRPSTSARWRSDPTERRVGVRWRSPVEPGRGGGRLWGSVKPAVAPRKSGTS